MALRIIWWKSLFNSDITIKIGNSWVLDKNQPNPKGGKRKMKESFTVTVGTEPNMPLIYLTKYDTVYSEKEAKELAKKWAEEHKDQYVYIQYDRASDGQQGYLNPSGYDIHGEDWAEEYK